MVDACDQAVQLFLDGEISDWELDHLLGSLMGIKIDQRLCPAELMDKLLKKASRHEYGASAVVVGREVFRLPPLPPPSDSLPSEHEAILAGQRAELNRQWWQDRLRPSGIRQVRIR